MLSYTYSYGTLFFTMPGVNQALKMILSSTTLKAYLCAHLAHRPLVWCEVKGSQGCPREMRSLLLEAAVLASQAEAGSSGGWAGRQVVSSGPSGSGGSRVLWMLELRRRVLPSPASVIALGSLPDAGDPGVTEGLGWQWQGPAQSFRLLGHPGFKQESPAEAERPDVGIAVVCK